MKYVELLPVLPPWAVRVENVSFDEDVPTTRGEEKERNDYRVFHLHYPNVGITFHLEARLQMIRWILLLCFLVFSSVSAKNASGVLLTDSLQP